MKTDMEKQLAELQKARDAEQDGRKKAGLTNKINALEKKLEILEEGGDPDEKRIWISARSTTGRESYRRAGIKFTGELDEYGVFEEQLEILKADAYIKLEVIEPLKEKK